MTTTAEKALPAREIRLVGPYGVLAAAAAKAAWRITTAARRPPPTHRASTARRHIDVDLLDRKGTMQAFSDLITVTDLVFAAYVEKPAKQVAGNANHSVGRKSVAGSPTGSPTAIDQMLTFSARHSVVPVTETFPDVEGQRRTRASSRGQGSISYRPGQ